MKANCFSLRITAAKDLPNDYIADVRAIVEYADEKEFDDEATKWEVFDAASDALRCVKRLHGVGILTVGSIQPMGANICADRKPDTEVNGAKVWLSPIEHGNMAGLHPRIKELNEALAQFSLAMKSFVGAESQIHREAIDIRKRFDTLADEVKEILWRETAK